MKSIRIWELAYRFKKIQTIELLLPVKGVTTCKDKAGVKIEHVIVPFWRPLSQFSYIHDNILV